MRFDDSLTTVLSADTATGFGAQSTWRQLVDLIGRGRAAADAPTIARLRILRQVVPLAVRGATARAVAAANPPAGLVSLFAEDALAVAAPLLRAATLATGDWAALLPQLSPAMRAVLRHRRDLPAETVRALESFGTIDFVLSDRTGSAAQPAVVQAAFTAPVAPALVDPLDFERSLILDEPLAERPFVSLGGLAGGLPLVAEAMWHADIDAPTATAARGGFAVADILARIDAFNRLRGERPAVEVSLAPAGFRFETDATGIIRWVEGVPHAPLIGVSLEYAALQGTAQLDGIAAGAFRRRTPFADARLEVAGASAAAGSWRVSGVPAFDGPTGRFTGFRGSARRPRADEDAVRGGAARSPASDPLRQLVHELRTPTNAIAGFAEMIGEQLLGPVAEPYRARAADIRAQVTGLIAAIDDLDLAARIEGNALELRPTEVPVAALLDRVIAELVPLARLRGAGMSLALPGPDRVVLGDDRVVERLVGRLMATLVSAAATGERIGIEVFDVAGSDVALRFDRPAALASHPTDALLSLDAEREAEAQGSPLLGTGFALRLTQKLATELGGSLVIGPDAVTLRLPAADRRPADQASAH